MSEVASIEDLSVEISAIINLVEEDPGEVLSKILLRGLESYKKAAEAASMARQLKRGRKEFSQETVRSDWRIALGYPDEDF